MTINRIIKRARHMGRIRDGLVLCDICGKPASKELSQLLSWTVCAPCMLGEADSLDPNDFISVGKSGAVPSDPTRPQRPSQ